MIYYSLMYEKKLNFVFGNELSERPFLKINIKKYIA